MKIEVTEEDIKEAQFCPVQRAVNRKMSSTGMSRYYCSAGNKYAYLRDAHGRTIFRATLPKIAQDFIQAHNEDSPVSPISFNLIIEDATQ